MKVDLHSIAFYLFSSTPPRTTVVLNPISTTTIYGGLEGNSAASNSGEGVGSHCEAMKNGAVHRPLLQFDIAGSIPAGSTINRVNLAVDIQSLGDKQYYPATLHSVIADCDEGAGKCRAIQDNSLGGATCSATPRTGTEFLQAASASSLMRNPSGHGGTITWWSNSRMAADVQSWLDDPSANGGWTIVGDDETRNLSIQYYTPTNASLTVELDHRGALDHYFRAAWHWMNALLKDWQGTGAGGGMDRFRAERFHWTSEIDRARIAYHLCAAEKRWKRSAAEGAEPSSCKKWTNYFLVK